MFVWGSWKDVLDVEWVRFGGIEVSMISCFVVCFSSFIRIIMFKDWMVSGGIVFDIIGIKEIGCFDWLEIIVIVRMD